MSDFGKLVEGDPILTHKQAVEIAARWAWGKAKVVLPEFVKQGSAEIPDVLAFEGRHSLMIEVKVSRSDFLRDKKKNFRYVESKGMGNYRYFCCPHRLIGPLEVPDGWGLIYIYPDGRARQMIAADYKQANIEAEHDILYAYARRAVVKGLHAEIMKPIPKPEPRLPRDVPQKVVVPEEQDNELLDAVLEQIDSAA